MKVQIIVPCINLWKKYTEEALNSIFKAAETAKLVGDLEDYRILLIDNGSSDETKVEAGKLVSQHFSHKRNEEQWGFQKSVNFGVNDAWERGFDIAMVCNNDIILNPFAITEIIDFYNTTENKEIGMVTCMNIASECPDPKDIYDKKPVDKEWTPISPHPDFSAFTVKRSTWERVGEFDELFAPAYFEDNDYHYRMQLEGKEAVTYPRALYYHYGSRTQIEALGKPLVTNAKFEDSRVRYVKKWGGLPGQEKFKHPYNNPMKSVARTLQSDER